MSVYKQVFRYQPPMREVVLTKKLLRETLENVRDQLLRGDINGGGKKLKMQTICHVNKCGTAACIGGWVGIMLVGNENAHEVFSDLIRVDRRTDARQQDLLHNLFYGFEKTDDFDEPNVAATAIQRYLNGKEPWPKGAMPDRLRYRYKRSKK